MDDSGSLEGSLSENIDLMEELLSGDCWLGSPNDLFEQPSNNSVPILEDSNSDQLDDPEQTETGTSWGRLVHSRTPALPLEDRLFRAVTFIQQSQLESHLLIQIWVPFRIGNRQFLTTCDQPFWLDPTSQSLTNYRSVSLAYQFSASEGSGEAVGMPGRVFLGRVPEWTPDVRYFSSTEYPRVGHARQCNVSGTIALPIFERDGRSCVAVLEVVSTVQKINYGSELENICNALQAVDLRSSDVLNAPCVKESNDSYQAALPEILNVLRAVCETHSLPLAQTWIPCIQQDDDGDCPTFYGAHEGDIQEPEEHLAQ
ncbi:protein NLP1-like [Iris pallida]|uniref:Protein NLP1-like n=1 Tax=Iris pallida TaxID=29817 RepID=A0AAX6I9H5_IRIPA|nr:protein NLP1-like [Iris pallida]